MMAVRKHDRLEERFWLFFLASLGAHGLFFLALAVFPSWMRPSLTPLVAPMIVDLVAPPSEIPSASPPAARPEASRAAASPEKKPLSPPPEKRGMEKVRVPEKKAPEKVSSEKAVPAEVPAKRALVSQRKRPPAEETNRTVVDSALKDIARRVEEGPSSAIREALRGVEAEVRNSERNGPSGEGERAGGAAAARALDLYIAQAAYRVQQNWAYAGQGRAGEGAVVVFYISRDGRVRDLSLKQSSGNRLIDDSARRAILKSEPFPPVPDAVREDRVGMGLRFTDKGVDL